MNDDSNKAAIKSRIIAYMRANCAGWDNRAKLSVIASGIMDDVSQYRQRTVANCLAELAESGSIQVRKLKNRKKRYWMDSDMGLKPVSEVAATAAHSVTEQRLRDECAGLRAQIKELSRERIKDDALGSVYQRALSSPMGDTEWMMHRPQPGSNSGVHHATACICVCDTHYDEVVDPAQVMGLNAYDREIAESRTERLMTNAIKMLRRYTAGVAIDGVCVMQAGDILSGMIHDELRQTNAASITVSVVHWAERLAAVYGAWADEFGKVAVHVVSGNHGRLDRKPRAKGGVQDNFDYLLGALLAKHFANDDRVSVVLAESFDLPVRVYDTRFLLTHGDQARGGSGIAGALSPMLIMDARKRKNHAYDWLVCGHWHQYMPGWRGIIMGGTTKGIDEYGLRCNFPIETPSQALWITTPERGVTQTAPIFVEKKGVAY